MLLITKFIFNKLCLDSFQKQKEALIYVPIMQPHDYSVGFEIMCDASDFTVVVVLGQRKY